MYRLTSTPTLGARVLVMTLEPADAQSRVVAQPLQELPELVSSAS